MTTKLISANLGVRLLLEVDGDEREIEYNVLCPSLAAAQPMDLITRLGEIFYLEFGKMKFVNKKVPIAKSKRLKPVKHVTQEEFNRKIKELGY